jgi:hypothetical protein
VFFVLFGVLCFLFLFGVLCFLFCFGPSGLRCELRRPGDVGDVEDCAWCRATCVGGLQGLEVELCLQTGENGLHHVVLAVTVMKRCLIETEAPLHAGEARVHMHISVTPIREELAHGHLKDCGVDECSLLQAVTDARDRLGRHERVVNAEETVAVVHGDARLQMDRLHGTACGRVEDAVHVAWYCTLHRVPVLYHDEGQERRVRNVLCRSRLALVGSKELLEVRGLRRPAQTSHTALRITLATC